MTWLKNFLTRNTVLLKAIRTLLQVLIAWGLLALTSWLGGFAIPADVQAAIIGVVAAALSVLMAELGRWLPEPTETEV